MGMCDLEVRREGKELILYTRIHWVYEALMIQALAFIVYGLRYLGRPHPRACASFHSGDKDKIYNTAIVPLKPASTLTQLRDD
jgi:hypothetical protein